MIHQDMVARRSWVLGKGWGKGKKLKVILYLSIRNWPHELVEQDWKTTARVTIPLSVEATYSMQGVGLKKAVRLQQRHESEGRL